MNVACDYDAPMQMLTTEKYIASGTNLDLGLNLVRCTINQSGHAQLCQLIINTASMTNLLISACVKGESKMKIRFYSQ